jgi:hypothetical protein
MFIWGGGGAVNRRKMTLNQLIFVHGFNCREKNFAFIVYKRSSNIYTKGKDSVSCLWYCGSNHKYAGGPFQGPT